MGPIKVVGGVRKGRGREEKGGQGRAGQGRVREVGDSSRNCWICVKVVIWQQLPSQFILKVYAQ